MGLLRKVARKSVRKVTPRPIRQVNRAVRHPVSVITPRPVRHAERSVYNITHPINAVENRVASAVVGPPIRYVPRKAPRPAAKAVRPSAAPGKRAPAPASASAGEEHDYDQVRELADRADPSTRQELVNALDHWDPMVRKLAVRGIGRLDDLNDNSMLVAALSDPSADVRIEAVHEVELRATEHLREPLIQALNDPHRLVRERAAHAIARLDGQTTATAHESAPAGLSEPSPHAIDDNDPPDLLLALNVSAHHGEIVLSVRELLEVLGRKKLTQAARDELEDIIDDAGLSCSPHVDKLDFDGQIQLTRQEVIPEFALRAHVDASGPWTLPVEDLLRAFDRSNLTARARTEIAEALEYVDLTAEPSMSEVEANDDIVIRRAS